MKNKEKSLTKPQMCLVLRDNIEIWFNKEKAKTLLEWLSKPKAGLIQAGGQFINPVDVIGIFTPEMMDQKHRLSRKQWQCKFGEWHNQFDHCACHESILPKWEPPVD